MINKNYEQYISIKINSNFDFIYRIIFVVLLTLFFSPNIKSQFLDDVCLSGGKLELDYRKKPWKANNQFLMKYLEEIGYFKHKEKIRYLVPVKFWVYHDNEGKGGASISDIKEFIDDLNTSNKLNQTGIQFYISDIKHVNKTKRQVMGYYMESTCQSFFKHTKTALNVYLIDGFKKKQESKRVVRGTYNLLTNSIILQRKNSNTGLTHEVGHYFGLLHPHRNFDKGKSKQEPVSRIRTKNTDGTGIPLCEERGDFLSDTKAEPKLTNLVDNDCKFTGSALKDAWGDNYASDVNNIMSYPTHYNCRDSFTTSQKAVMLYSAAVNKYSKYWDIGKAENQKYLFDKNEPDDYMEIAGSIPTDSIQAFNFHKVFMGKNKDRSDTCDWIKFEVKQYDKRNVKISINADAKNTKAIRALLYDKNQNQISKIKTASPGETVELGFQGLVSDWYYIKVISLENNSEHVDSYTVDVQLYE